MRSEEDILNQIINFSMNDSRIRVVLMNGSRVNPKSERDILQDYDFMFLVENPKDFMIDKHWMDVFGKTLISQCYDFSGQGRERYIFLSLYNDYVRIDIQIFSISEVKYCQCKSSLTTVLIDKDNLCDILPESSDKSHIVKRPNEEEYSELIGNFWWFTTCAAKGLWRDELPIAKYNFDFICHHEILVKILAWYVGMKNNWNINVGKNGKWLKKYLPREIWDQYLKTFADADTSRMWNAIFEAGLLVDRIGIEIANTLDFNYPVETAQNMTKYLKYVKELPKT